MRISKFRMYPFIKFSKFSYQLYIVFNIFYATINSVHLQFSQLEQSAIFKPLLKSSNQSQIVIPPNHRRSYNEEVLNFSSSINLKDKFNQNQADLIDFFNHSNNDNKTNVFANSNKISRNVNEDQINESDKSIYDRSHESSRAPLVVLYDDDLESENSTTVTTATNQASNDMMMNASFRNNLDTLTLDRAQKVLEENLFLHNRLMHLLKKTTRAPTSDQDRPGSDDTNFDSSFKDLTVQPNSVVNLKPSLMNSNKNILKLQLAHNGDYQFPLMPMKWSPTASRSDLISNTNDNITINKDELIKFNDALDSSRLSSRPPEHKTLERPFRATKLAPPLQVTKMNRYKWDNLDSSNNNLPIKLGNDIDYFDGLDHMPFRHLDSHQFDVDWLKFYKQQPQQHQQQHQKSLGSSLINDDRNEAFPNEWRLKANDFSHEPSMMTNFYHHLEQSINPSIFEVDNELTNWRNNHEARQRALAKRVPIMKRRPRPLIFGNGAGLSGAAGSNLKPPRETLDNYNSMLLGGGDNLDMPQRLMSTSSSSDSSITNGLISSYDASSEYRSQPTHQVVHIHNDKDKKGHGKYLWPIVGGGLTMLMGFLIISNMLLSIPLLAIGASSLFNQGGYHSQQLVPVYNLSQLITTRAPSGRRKRRWAIETTDNKIGSSYNIQHEQAKISNSLNYREVELTRIERLIDNLVRSSRLKRLFGFGWNRKQVLKAAYCHSAFKINQRQQQQQQQALLFG